MLVLVPEARPEDGDPAHAGIPGMLAAQVIPGTSPLEVSDPLIITL